MAKVLDILAQETIDPLVTANAEAKEATATLLLRVEEQLAAMSRWSKTCGWSQLPAGTRTVAELLRGAVQTALPQLGKSNPVPPLYELTPAEADNVIIATADKAVLACSRAVYKAIAACMEAYSALSAQHGWASMGKLDAENLIIGVVNAGWAQMSSFPVPEIHQQPVEEIVE